MNNVIIIGAGGQIARQVTGMLLKSDDIMLTLFLRNRRKLNTGDYSGCRIIEGDVLNYKQLQPALTGQDVVYVNLAGELEAMAENIVKAMKEADVKRVIFISSIGIYDMPLRAVLKPYRKAADVIESSGLDYTILRPTWFTTANEVDYELTRREEPEKGSVISQKSLAAFIAKVIGSPEQYVNANLGINKPHS